MSCRRPSSLSCSATPLSSFHSAEFASGTKYGIPFPVFARAATVPSVECAGLMRARWRAACRDPVVDGGEPSHILQAVIRLADAARRRHGRAHHDRVGVVPAVLGLNLFIIYRAWTCCGRWKTGGALRLVMTGLLLGGPCRGQRPRAPARPTGKFRTSASSAGLRALAPARSASGRRSR